MKAVLLAAGKSSRVWPFAQDRNKCMLEFLGRPLIFHAIGGLIQAGIKEFVIVVGEKDSSVRDYLGDGSKLGVKVEYAVQKKPLGTGDALLCAEKLVNGSFVVCNATNAEAGSSIAGKSGELVVAVRSNDAGIYGVVDVKNGFLAGIEEKPKSPKSCLISCATFVLNKGFFGCLKKEKGEYSLVDAVNSYCKKNRVKVVEVKHHVSLKYPWHILDVNRFFLDGIRHSVSRKARVGRNVSITGSVVVEDGAVIEDNVVIKGPCYVGKNCAIRSFCLLREHTALSENVLLGCGTETKNCVIYDKAKTHMNYVGDSVLGSGVHLGCGTVTANRRNDRANVKSAVKGEFVDTGTSALGAFIGANTHTGVNCSIMPGIKIGSACIIGPASVVFDDVPDSSKMYSKFNRIVKKRME